MSYLPALRMAAASHARAGQLVEARKAMARIRQLDPDLRISKLSDVVPSREPKDFDRYVDVLRKAALPE